MNPKLKAEPAIVDENGQREDAAIHEPMLADKDANEAADAMAMKAALRLGLTAAQARALIYPKKKD